MRLLTLLRHAESEANYQDILQGQVDSPLTPQGLAQARRLAERWRALGVSFDRIISSPLLRARQTAEAVGEALGMPVTVDPIWTERSFGQLEGRRYAEIQQLDPPVDYYEPYEAIGQTGESQVDLYLRACQALQGLLRQSEGNYLVVSHGALLGKVMYAIFGITPQGHYYSPMFIFENLTYVQLGYQAKRRQWQLLCFCNPDLWDGKLPVMASVP